MFYSKLPPGGCRVSAILIELHDDDIIRITRGAGDRGGLFRRLSQKIAEQEPTRARISVLSESCLAFVIGTCAYARKGIALLFRFAVSLVRKHAKDAFCRRKEGSRGNFS